MLLSIDIRNDASVVNNGITLLTVFPKSDLLNTQFYSVPFRLVHCVFFNGV